MSVRNASRGSGRVLGFRLSPLGPNERPAVLTIAFVAGVNAGYFGTVGALSIFNGSAFDAFENLVFD